MISIDKSQGQNVITLNNYPKYNPAYGQPTDQAAPQAATPEPHDAALTQKPPKPTNTPPQPKSASQAKPQPSNPRQKPSTSTEHYRQITEELVEHWNQCNDTAFRSVNARIPQVRQRLKTFNVEELKKAIKTRSADPWIKQNNQQSNWDALFRNDKQIEHWLERSPKPAGNGALKPENTMSETEARRHAEQTRRQFSPGLYTTVEINGETRYIKPDSR